MRGAGVSFATRSRSSTEEYALCSPPPSSATIFASRPPQDPRPERPRHAPARPDSRPDRLHAVIGPGVEHLAVVRHEDPGVARRVQRRFQDPEVCPVARLRSGVQRAAYAVVLAARPDDKLADARRVGAPGRVQLRQALIVVLVAV